MQTTFDGLIPNFWKEKIKCYELKQVMRQSDEQFINILNQNLIATQFQLDVYTINNQCFHKLPNDQNFPYLFYMNEAKQNMMDQISFKMKGMYSYCVHKFTS
jgi:hypothetical protein